LTISGEYYRGLVSGEHAGWVPGLMREGLRALSVPYGWAVRLRNSGYDAGRLRRHRADVPVVSIGNLTLGGTGKTPCVEYVARFFAERQLRVAILSRGYGARGRNDEALLLDENLPEVPHLQGPDRVALAYEARACLGSDVLVLDDGFQHRRLARDLDVVLIDATNPWGGGHLFPRGLLREPIAALQRADIVMLTRCDLVDAAAHAELRQALARIAPGMPVVETSHRALGLAHESGRADIGRLRGRPLLAFCGLGNPRAFRRTLDNLGLNVADFRTFPDHHHYSPADLDELAAWAQGQAADSVVVTTQKDLVKLRRTALGGKELWALRVGLHFEAGQALLDHKLGSVMARLPRGARVA
jgi:tetraacyldisaccharide 4'-kinase